MPVDGIHPIPISDGINGWKMLAYPTMKEREHGERQR
jgi:hypothetical protein